MQSFRQLSDQAFLEVIHIRSKWASVVYAPAPLPAALQPRGLAKALDADRRKASSRRLRALLGGSWGLGARVSRAVACVRTLVRFGCARAARIQLACDWAAWPADAGEASGSVAQGS